MGQEERKFSKAKVLIRRGGARLTVGCAQVQTQSDWDRVWLGCDG